MFNRLWHFWIDAGGTFTDCIAHAPDETLLRHKVLSSGAVRGAVAAGSDRQTVVDTRRGGDRPGHWDGYWLTVIGKDGDVLAESRVRRFSVSVADDADAHGRRGVFELETPLDVEPSEGTIYELRSGEEAPIVAIRYLMGLKLSEAIPPVDVRLGTTRGTNALITRSGARTALVTTRGFGDVLDIGYQDRPQLFELAIRKPTPLHAAVLEVDERMTFDGRILATPDVDAVRDGLEGLRQKDIESLAICLLHGHSHPQHERLMGEIAREVGFDEISLSSEVAPLAKIVSRGDTTVLDAYLNPVLRRYFSRLQDAIGQSELKILTSAGGLVAADRFVGKDSLLSGPAGGVVGFSQVAEAAGFGRAIGFDMGGTSTDVARYDGRYELEYETEKSGVRVVAPMMAIETVAAGGGSVCRFDGVKLVVGPESAGADPGPACYGRGGPLAVTDMNFYLGRVPVDRFPFPLDRAAVEAQMDTMCAEIAAATGREYTFAELAEGFLQIANANMAKAIQSISVAKGADPKEYVLVSFGGAAPQHACDVARQLGIRQVLNHPDSGILSARGIGLARVERHAVVGVYQPFSVEAVTETGERLNELAAGLRVEVEAERIIDTSIDVRRVLEIRYQGQDASLAIPWPAGGDFSIAFETEHQLRYGYLHTDRALEIVTGRVEVSAASDQTMPESHSIATSDPEPRGKADVYFAGQLVATNIFDRERLCPGNRLVGPAIVRESHTTTVIDPGWSCEVLSAGELLLTDARRSDASRISADADPIMLEIFNNRFSGIAERMGITLRNTASSVNVKERLDFSCAIFTPSGELVVNAPHIPVHLGAMGETVRNVLSDYPQLDPGNVIVTNDPYHGGSHLPDITVVTPVHDQQEGRLLFFTASRAHHAEIGGICPGSMPPFSKNLAEEGVLIRNFKLVERGKLRTNELRDLFLSGKYPTRAVDDNLADIEAQMAANRRGAQELAELVRHYQLPVVEAYMRHIQTAAEEKTRRAIASLPAGRHTFTDHMDDGSAIRVVVSVDHQTSGKKPVVIDFSGTAPVHAGNLNANWAIVTAAVMYCLRLMLDEDIPLNEGVLRPVEIVLPIGLLCPPEGATPAQSAAVAGGNVETSQRVVDVLLGALRLAAASQGTMNNLIFGDASFGYYETICGGAGATAKADGADAVHTHLTNTRITDAEIIERRYPVVVREFSIRRGSGGSGLHCGGDGVVRRIEFLRDLEVTLLTQRRGTYPPYGIDGGESGAAGRNTLQRADGTSEELYGQAQFLARPGDILTIETPGGGGWGTARSTDDSVLRWDRESR